jgi:hypothetical protein
MSKAGKLILEGLQDAVAYAKINALWHRTKKKPGEDVTRYDWGYRDGLMAAKALFGTEHVVKVPRKTTRKKTARVDAT